MKKLKNSKLLALFLLILLVSSILTYIFYISNSEEKVESPNSDSYVESIVEITSLNEVIPEEDEEVVIEEGVFQPCKIKLTPPAGWGYGEKDDYSLNMEMNNSVFVFYKTDETTTYIQTPSLVVDCSTVNPAWVNTTEIRTTIDNYFDRSNCNYSPNNWSISEYKDISIPELDIENAVKIEFKCKDIAHIPSQVRYYFSKNDLNYTIAIIPDSRYLDLTNDIKTNFTKYIEFK